MLDEFVLVPDIFDPAAYSNPAFIEMCLPHSTAAPAEALVRDLRDGGWSRFCMEHSGEPAPPVQGNSQEAAKQQPIASFSATTRGYTDLAA